MPADNTYRITGSLMKAVRNGECPEYIRRKFVEHERIEPTTVMQKGLYFEQLVLGANSRDQFEVPMKPGKDRKPPKSASKETKWNYLVGRLRITKNPEVRKRTDKQLQAVIDRLPDDREPDEPTGWASEIIDLANRTKKAFHGLGISIIESQLNYKDNELSGWVDAAIQFQGRGALLELKYTETRRDDRWHGWADLENVDMTQARHYTLLHKRRFGEFIPFYLFIVGKSGWFRFVQVVCSEQALDAHQNEIEAVKDRMALWEETGFPAEPEYSKCQDCPFRENCIDAETLPTLEKLYL